MEGETNFTLEGQCILSLSHEESTVVFFCDGFDTIFALHHLPELGKIKTTAINIDSFREEDSNSWKSYAFDDFNPIDNINDLINLFKLIKGVYINNLEMMGSDFFISIYDNREFVITFNSDKYPDFFNYGITSLLTNCLFLSEEASLNIIETLKMNNDRSVVIGISGNVMQIFKDHQEYHSSDLYKKKFK